MGGHLVPLLLACSAATCGALLLPATRVLTPQPCTSRATSPVCKARGKGEARGFGKKPASSATTSKESGAANAPAESTPSPSRVLSKEASNRGKEALERMRREAGVDRAAERAKAQRQLLTEEELAPIDPSAGVMPEVVSQRMLRRVIPFAGLPLSLRPSYTNMIMAVVFGSFALFGAFYYANTQLDLDLPPSIVAYSTQARALVKRYHCAQSCRAALAFSTVLRLSGSCLFYWYALPSIHPSDAIVIGDAECLLASP
eukprot:6185166-Pleurochrysis_carterae.AAC.4